MHCQAPACCCSCGRGCVGGSCRSSLCCCFHCLPDTRPPTHPPTHFAFAAGCLHGGRHHALPAAPVARRAPHGADKGSHGHQVLGPTVRLLDAACFLNGWLAGFGWLVVCLVVVGRRPPVPALVAGCGEVVQAAACSWPGSAAFAASAPLPPSNPTAAKTCPLSLVQLHGAGLPAGAAAAAGAGRAGHAGGPAGLTPGGATPAEVSKTGPLTGLYAAQRRRWRAAQCFRVRSSRD